ncbi:MAG: FecR domain-containing protein [Alphaproteobacteria bacterium]|nr:FecR domain-containing protein [Alphaproteobacteria bacterium]
MFRRSVFLLPILLALALPACAADKKAPPVIAGHVSRIQESAMLNGLALTQKGALVHVGDKLSTGKDSRLELRFTDGGTLVLGENGQLVVDAYLYDPVKIKGNSLLSVVQGAFKATTAGIAKLEDQPYKVRTAVATIGIRGTTFWGGGLGEGSGYNVLVLEGKGVVVENQLGKVELAGAGLGTSIAAGGAPGAPVVWSPERQAEAAATVSFK